MPTSPDRFAGPVLRHQWALLRAAIQLLTRIPIPAPYGPETTRQAARYFPLVGAAIGLAAATAFTLARIGLPPLPAALLATAATALLTGALHEDGLADTCDGLFGGRDAPSALRIMRDSRIGSFGTLALILVLGTKLSCLAAIPDPAPALVAAHAASRFWPVALAASLPYARPDPSTAATVAGPGATELTLAALTAAATLLLLGPRAIPALLLAAATAAALAVTARRRIGGYTGDILGTAQQLTETTILLAAAWHAA